MHRKDDPFIDLSLPDKPIVNPLCSPDTISALRRKHLFAFNKSLGQHFLINPRIPYNIVRASGVDGGMGVLEIGPGIGCLTFELAKQAARVVAVEIDGALLPVLQETLPFDNVFVVHADVMKLDLHDLFPKWFGNLPVAVVANLPYYITTPIVMQLLENAPPLLQTVTVMVQLEVANRLCAPPGTPDSGAISLAVDYYSRARFLFKVPAANFVPMPKVDSAIVRFDLRREPPVRVSDTKLMFELIKQGFGQRRKTLVNAIGNQGVYPKTELAQALDRMKLPQDIRAERMTLQQFAALTDILTGGAPPRTAPPWGF